MNVFFLDKNPVLCAQAHYDTHVVKMILESGQLLSTAHHVCGDGGPYKITHQHHPSAIWVRSNANHYSWLYCLMIELGKGYTYRFGKEHKTIRDHKEFLFETPSGILTFGWQDPPQAMPEDCQGDNAILAYRDYYTTHKLHLMKYTRRKPPAWLTNRIDTMNSIST